MSKGLNRVFCHRKSGAGYVVRSVMANFYCDDFDKCHWPHSRNMNEVIESSGVSLYVVRDGRDVLVDCYKYFCEQPGTKEHFEGKSFRQYLMGFIEAYSDEELFDKTAETKNPLQPLMFSDPTQYWINHVNSYVEECNVSNLYFVNYDMMLTDGASMLMHLGAYFDLEPRYKLIEPLEDLLCYKPLIRDVGMWRKYFGEKDMDYFWGRAEGVMVKLKYSYV